MVAWLVGTLLSLFLVYTFALEGHAKLTLEKNHVAHFRHELRLPASVVRPWGACEILVAALVLLVPGVGIRLMLVMCGARGIAHLRDRKRPLRFLVWLFLTAVGYVVLHLRPSVRLHPADSVVPFVGWGACQVAVMLSGIDSGRAAALAKLNSKKLD